MSTAKVYVPRQTHDCDAAVLVPQHLPGFLARLEESGHSLPEFVKRELEELHGWTASTEAPSTTRTVSIAATYFSRCTWVCVDGRPIGPQIAEAGASRYYRGPCLGPSP